MKKTVLEKNRDLSEKFIQPIDYNNPRLNPFLEKIFHLGEIKCLIDLGCGDGAFIHSIKKFYPKIKVHGVDISPRRVNHLKKEFPGETFLCEDVCNTKINKKFDLVHSSQVIEHLEDDKKMISEIKDLIKPAGYVYVSSVIKKPFSVYKYRNNGNFVLDPTHEKEYKNKKEFLDLFKKDFKLLKYRVYPVKRNIFGLTIKIPGYYIIEGLWKS